MDKTTETTASTSDDMQIIRAKEVMEMTGLAKSTLYSLDKRDDTFPKRVSLGVKGGAVGWVKAEIANWIQSKKEQR